MQSRTLQPSPMEEIHVLNGCCWLNHTDGVSMRLNARPAQGTVNMALLVSPLIVSESLEGHEGGRSVVTPHVMRLEEIHPDCARERLHKRFGCPEKCIFRRLLFGSTPWPGWFSGHFHLSHDYEDSITFPGEALVCTSGALLGTVSGLASVALQAATGAATASLHRQE